MTIEDLEDETLSAGLGQVPTFRELSDEERAEADALLAIVYDRAADRGRRVAACEHWMRVALGAGEYMRPHGLNVFLFSRERLPPWPPVRRLEPWERPAEPWEPDPPEGWTPRRTA